MQLPSTLFRSIIAVTKRYCRILVAKKTEDAIQVLLDCDILQSNFIDAMEEASRQLQRVGYEVTLYTSDETLPEPEPHLLIASQYPLPDEIQTAIADNEADEYIMENLASRFLGICVWPNGNPENYLVINFYVVSRILDGREEILTGLARNIYLNAYADTVEDRGGSFGGGEINDMAPNTPPSAEAKAIEWLQELEEENRLDIERIWAKARFADWFENQLIPDPEDFGNDLSMMMIGHGVSWFDDHARFPLKEPYQSSPRLSPSPESNFIEDLFEELQIPIPNNPRLLEELEWPNEDTDFDDLAHQLGINPSTLSSATEEVLGRTWREIE